MSIIKEPTKAHQEIHRELVEVMKKHLADEPAEILLAIGAQLVGQLIAMQDQRRITPAIALLIVEKNIEIGNTNALLEIMSSKGQG